MYPIQSAAGQVISTILKHDRKVNTYKIALLRAINDLMLTYPDVRLMSRDVAGPSGAAEYVVTYRRGSSLYAVRVAAGDGSLLGGGEQLIGSVSNSSTPVRMTTR